MENEILEKHSLPIIYLFKGVLYNSNEAMWKALIHHQNEIKKYFHTVGIEVIINESEGFAFLKQMEFPEDESQNIPKLIEKRPLSYPVTLLCVLLRKRLLEFDNSGEESNLILSIEQIQDILRTFLQDNTTHEKKIIDKIDIHIRKLIDLGFIRELKNTPGKFEVSRILVAYIPVEKLQEVLDKLEEYHSNWAESLKDKKKNELDL
ncbi:MAG: DUF4194 domain-containing protein [Chitinophagaceae bacterium]|nr:DUF4194 domain-containing protein [Chitinophagaceae bacterium]